MHQQVLPSESSPFTACALLVAAAAVSLGISVVKSAGKRLYNFRQFFGSFSCAASSPEFATVRLGPWDYPYERNYLL